MLLRSSASYSLRLRLFLSVGEHWWGTALQSDLFRTESVVKDTLPELTLEQYRRTDVLELQSAEPVKHVMSRSRRGAMLSRHKARQLQQERTPKQRSWHQMQFHGRTGGERTHVAFRYYNIFLNFAVPCMSFVFLVNFNTVNNNAKKTRNPFGVCKTSMTSSEGHLAMTCTRPAPAREGFSEFIRSHTVLY